MPPFLNLHAIARPGDRWQHAPVRAEHNTWTTTAINVSHRRFQIGSLQDETNTRKTRAPDELISSGRMSVQAKSAAITDPGSIPVYPQHHRSHSIHVA